MLMLFGWPPSFSETVDTQPHIALVASRESVERDSAVSIQPDLDWREYVESLSQPDGTFAPPHVQAVVRFWNSVRQALGDIVLLPMTQPAADGSIQMSWARGPHYVQVDVYPDSMIEWFYRNRDTNQIDGTTDERSLGLAQPLLERMRQTLS